MFIVDIVVVIWFVLVWRLSFNVFRILVELILLEVEWLLCLVIFILVVAIIKVIVVEILKVEELFFLVL